MPLPKPTNSQSKLLLNNMTQLRIVPLPLGRLEQLAQDEQARHDCITEMLIKELEREDAEMILHPLFTEPDEAFTREVQAQKDYALGNLGLSERRQWLWFARNWRKWAGRLAGMIAIAASATTVIALIWMVLCR